MPASAKRQRNGDSDISDNSSDEMEYFNKQKFTQQRQLIFEKLLSIEKVNKEKFENLTEEIKLLKQKIVELEDENVKLKNNVNYVNQSSLSDSVIIYGVPNNKQISDLSVVKNLGDKLNIPVDENDVSDIFRIGPKPTESEDEEDNDDEPKCPPLVVKFTRKTVKMSFMTKRRNINLSADDIGLEKCKNRVYINEYLTKSNLELLKYSQRLKKYDVKYVWPAGGKILARWDSGGIFSINDKNQVDCIVRDREHSKSHRASFLRMAESMKS